MAEKRVNYELERLIEFLNCKDLDDLRPLGRHGPGNEARTRFYWLLAGTLYGDGDDADKLGLIQAEMRNDLVKLLRDRSTEQLDAILGRIDRMALKTPRGAWPIEKVTKDLRPSSFIEIAGKRFAICHFGHDKTYEAALWRIVDEAIRSNMFSQVRNCPHCGDFFLTSDPRKEYCSEKCRQAFRVKTKTAEGYYAEKMRDSRERKKAKVAKTKRQEKNKKTADGF